MSNRTRSCGKGKGSRGHSSFIRSRASSSVASEVSSDVVLTAPDDSIRLTQGNVFHIVGGQHTRAFDRDNFLTIDEVNKNEYFKNYKEFIKNKCVRLDTLVPYLKNLSRGNQHKLVTLIINDIKNWELTWYNNTNKNYRSFIKIIKNLNIKNEDITKCLTLPWVQPGEFKPQMLSSFSKLSKTSDNMTAFFDNDLPKVMETLDKANKSCDSVNEFFDQLKNMLSGDTGNRMIFDLANKIYLVVSAIYHHAPADLLVSSILNLTSGLVLDVVVSRVLNALKSCPHRDVQGELMFESQTDIADEDDVNFLSAICSGIVGSITGLFGTLHKEAFAKYTINIKRITALSVLLRSCSTIFSYFAAIFSFGLNICMKFIRKYVGKLPKCLQPDSLIDIYEALEYIEANNIIENSKINGSSARCIIEFRNKLNDVLKNTKDTSVNRASLLYLSHIKREAETWYKEIPPYLRDVPGSDRSRPAWVYIYGAPRIGKTAVVAKMIIHSCAKSMKLIDDNEKWDSFVYSRNLGEPYWEGYNSHPVVSYTDILQEIKDEQKLDLAITELGRINDSNCYSLPMAFEGPKGKGKNFFTSRLIVSDAQGNFGDTVLDQRCWSRGIHIHGRRTVVLQVELNPTYKGENDIGINYAAYEKAYEAGNFIGTMRLPVAPQDAYIFTVRDSITHLPIKTFTNLLETIDYVTQKCVQFDLKEHSQIDSITEFCKSQYSCDKSLSVDNDTKQINDMFQGWAAHRYAASVSKIDGYKGVNYGDSPKFDRHSILGIEQERLMNKMDKHQINAFMSQTDIEPNDKFLSPYNSPRKLRATNESFVCTCYDKEETAIMFEIHDMPHRCFSTYEEANHYVIERHINTGRFVGRMATLKGLLLKHIKSYGAWFADIKNKLVDKWKEFTANYPLWSIVVKTASLISVIVASFKVARQGYNWFAKKQAVDNEPVIELLEYDLAPQTHEMKESKQKHKPKVRVRKSAPKGEVHMESQSTTTINAQSNRHLYINALCRLYARSSDRYGNTELMTDTAFNIVGNTFVITNHFWTRLQQYKRVDPKFVLSLEWCSRNQTSRINIDIESIKVFPREMMWHHAEDITYITIPSLGLGRDLRTSFSSVNDTPDLSHCVLFGLRSAKHVCDDNCKVVSKVKNGVIEIVELARTRMLGFEGPVANLNYDTQEQYIGVNKVPAFNTQCTQYILYGGAKTAGGDCMMLIEHQDPKYIGKIIGVHTAGDVKRDYGAGSIIFKEDIDDVARYFGSIIKHTNFEYITTEVPLTGFGSQAACLDLQPLGRPANFEKNGKVTNYKVNMPSKTKISESIFYDLMSQDFGPALTKPAHLRRTVINGVEVSPMLKGLEKLTKVSSPIPQREFDIIKEHIAISVCSWSSPWLTEEKHILSDFESMNGFDGLKGIDVSTSAGFPWCRVSSIASKKPWVTESEGVDGKKLYTLKPLVAEAVENRIEMAKINEIKETYFVDTLKDETRPIQKVDAGKTRVFQVGPFDLTIAIRKYFGHFFAHLQNTYLTGEVAVGINPDSYDWTLFQKRLDEVDGEYMCGDYTNWDASIPFQAVELFVHCASKFYDDGPENERIRKVLIATVLSSDHFVDNLAFSVRQVSSSGHAATTHINNLWNMCVTRYVYLCVVERDLLNFNKCIRNAVYGDDGVQKVGGIAYGKLTMKTMQKVTATIGLEYTTADKSHIIDDYQPLEKVTFLKRGFVKDKIHNIILAPLDINVISEIARWSESNPLNVVDQMARFNQTLMFASSHGPSLFSKYRSAFIRYCDAVLRGDLVDHNGRVLILDYDATQLFTYERCKQIFYPTHYGLSCDLGTLAPGVREAIATALCEL